MRGKDAKIMTPAGTPDKLRSSLAVPVERRLYFVLGLILPTLFLTTQAFSDTALPAPTVEGLKSLIEAQGQMAFRVWILVAAGLVFMMQAGFALFEIGMVRHMHGPSVGMKNLLDWMLVSLVFVGFGFAFMFGPSSNGIVGLEYFGLPQGIPIGREFILFQLAFAGTAATIVSGAMAERTAILPYMIISVVVGGLIYPVFGHWAWSSALDKSNQGWLEKLGFIDFAGSTVVHSIGGWVSLAGVMLVGPRDGRFGASSAAMRSSNPGLSAVGVLVLWLGWWGFNGGSTRDFEKVADIILTTTVCGVSAGLMALFHAMAFDKKQRYSKLLGGVLGGLVAITASCDNLGPGRAVLIGIVAGYCHNKVADWLVRRKLDDPVGAIPVHLACGVLGTLAVMLGDASNFKAETWVGQLGVQILGIAVAGAFSFGLSFVVFLGIRHTIGLRASRTRETDGDL